MTLVASPSFDPSIDYLSLACLAAVMRSDTSQAVACLLAGADPDVYDPSHHRTVLHWAAFQGLIDVIRVALRAGADDRAVDDDGYAYTDLLSADDVPKVARFAVLH